MVDEGVWGYGLNQEVVSCCYRNVVRNSYVDQILIIQSEAWGRLLNYQCDRETAADSGKVTWDRDYVH